MNAIRERLKISRKFFTKFLNDLYSNHALRLYNNGKEERLLRLLRRPEKYRRIAFVLIFALPLVICCPKSKSKRILFKTG